MTHWKKLFDYRFIAGEDLQGKEVTVTIEAIEKDEAFNARTLKKEQVNVMRFVGKKKAIILNKVNSRTIEKLLGTSDYEDWIGKEITIYPQPDPNHGEVIRVKPKVNM